MIEPIKLLVILLILCANAPAQSAGWIVIPVEQYRTLRGQAYPTAAEPDAPPVDATLTRVEYDLRVQNDVASGRAILTVDVIKDGWVRVPIPAGLLIREARLDGKRVPLVSGAALLARTGRAVLTLDIALPVATMAGEERLTLPPAASGTTRATLVVSRPDLDLKVTGGVLLESSAGKWMAFARGNEALSFAWRRKQDNHQTDLPLRLRGSVTQLLSLGEDSTSITAEVSIEVVQGAAREMRIQVPAGVTVNGVSGAAIADWDSQPGVLVVKFLESVERTASFAVSAEAKLPHDGAIDVPMLRLAGVERETGGLAVEVLGAGEIKNIRTQGLETAGAASLSPAIAARQSPSLLSYRFRQSAMRTLSVGLVRYTQQAVLTANIEEARYRVLMSQEGKTLVQARYAVRNNQRNFARVTLPAGSVVWSASVAGRTVRPGAAPDGSLLFPLGKARSGDDAPVAAIEVLYASRGAAWNDKGQARLTLPSTDLPVSRTGVVLYHPPAYRVTVEAGVFRPGSFEPPGSAALRSDALPPPEEEAPAAQKPVSATQALVDSFRAKADSRRVTVAPLSFPAVGPSLYLVSELTSEGQAPAVELSYQRDKKGGSK